MTALTHTHASISTSPLTLTRQLSLGLPVCQVTCDECGSVSERQEPFYDVMVNVKGFPYVTQHIHTHTSTHHSVDVLPSIPVETERPPIL